ncbi:MAG: hypothetical protein ACXWNC_00510 [Anaerolineales bacterium]
MRLQTNLILFLTFVLTAGCSSGIQESGTLTGHVDIGPLQPVQRVGEPQPTPSPAMYAAWRIVVLSEDGKREIADGEIDSSGQYQIKLTIGKYMVTARPVNGAGLGGQQVKPVEILMGKTIHLDISIDTGIR